MSIRAFVFRLPLFAFLLAAFAGAGCDNSVELDESGELIVEDLRAGTGATAASGTRLSVHAVGSVLNGCEFSDSHAEGRPLVFTLGVGMVIPGWEEGMPGMQVGGLRRLTIPPRMGFGTDSFDCVPANATLVYDVELLRVDHPDSLAIEDITVGTGPAAANGDSVYVRYVGHLGSGYVFDQTQGDRTLGIILGDARIIRGFNRGLVGMRQGGRRRLIIPSEMGYGNEWQGEIPPNSTLIFDIALVRVTDL